MAQIIDYFGVTDAEFYVGILVIALAFGVLLLALRPEREYSDLPRGVFPRHGNRHPTRQAQGTEPPVRCHPPEMSVAEGALMYRNATGVDQLVATILDLAARGFLRIVEYHHIPGTPPSVVLTYLRAPDEGCSDDEAHILETLAVPGAAETASYCAVRPFDVRRYRVALEASGIPPLGTPSARAAGLRMSLASGLEDSTLRHVQVDRGWLRSGRERVGTAGALELIGGIFGGVVSGIMVVTGALQPFWVIVCVLVGLLGLVTILGAAERTADGVVARDQVAGFRRYLTEDSESTGITLHEWSRFAGWAVALDCVPQWSERVCGLGPLSDQDVDTVLYWASRTSEHYSQWSDLEGIVTLLWRRTCVDPDSQDSRPNRW